MFKKVVGSIVFGLAIASIQPAHAADEQVLAIIDTAIDSNKITNVTYEACFTLKTCPNGTNFQEGKGSAMINDWKINGIDHGYNIAQAAIQANPSIKIVFVRITDENKYPTFSAIHTDGSSLDRAIDWVSKNSARLGIDAVSISQSRINFAVGTCPVDNIFTNSVKVLNDVKIPTFVATGNDGKTNQVGFPACTPGVIAVGALKPNVSKRPYPVSSYTSFANYTNIGPELDVVARGDADVVKYVGANITITGTSVATPIAAAIAISKYNGTSWSDFLGSFSKSAGYPYIS